MTMSPVHDATPVTLPAFITEPPKRTRKGCKRVSITGEPVVRELPDGTVSVALFGSRAAGRSMVLEADTWQGISQRFTQRWVINTDGHGREYVRSGGQHIGRAAAQPGDRPTATLSRLILGARRGERVVYENDNHLDLRLANLSLEYPRRSRERPAMAKRFRHNVDQMLKV